MSNGSRGLLRQVNATGCRDGGYFSDSLVSISDADASDCSNIGWASQAVAQVYGGAPKADRCGVAGFRTTVGGKMVLSESSSFTDTYASAQDCVGNAVVVDDGGDFFANKGDFSSTSTHAVLVAGASKCRMPATNIKSLAGRGVSSAEGSEIDLFGATVEGTGDAAVRSFNGGWVNVANAKLGGSTPALNLSGGTVAVVSATTTNLDASGAYTCNVMPGEYSKEGMILGADAAVTVRSTDASFSLSSSSAPTVLVTANLTQGRNVTTYDSTAYPNKRHLVVHSGLGSPLSLYQPAGVASANRIAAVAPGEAVWIMPNGSGGWRILTRFRRHIRRKQGDSELTMTPAVGDYVAITDPLEADRKIIMYDPADGDARPHVITRLDAAPFNAVIRNLADTETIGTVAANQFGVVAPHPDGTGWYIAMKGSRT